jgi:hypothetical protein
MASRALSGIQTLADAVQKNQSMVDQLNERIRKCVVATKRLKRERDRVLNDYRLGYFCNQCGRAKSEFPSEAAFFEHIREGASSGRHVVAATPQQIAAKEQQYANELASINRDRQRAQRARDAKVLEIQAAWSQIREGLNLWQAATSMEDLLIRAKEQNIQQQKAAAIQNAQRMLDQVEARKRQILSAGRPDKTTLDAIQGAEDLWQRQLVRANKAAQRRFSTFASEIDAANQAKTRDYQQITEATGKILTYAEYIRPPFGSLPDIGTVSMAPIAIVLPGADRVSLTVTSSQLGANFRFGSFVTAGLYGGEVNATTTEVTTFLQIFGAVREVRYLIEHPTETVDHTYEQQSKTEWENRRNELKDYALSLKQKDGAGSETKTQ